jgi:hypothetical protein
MNAPLADERAMLAHTRPNAFDELRNTGKLGLGMWTTPVEVKALAARRWAAGNELRRLHARGWANPCGGAPNPLTGHDAATARASLAEIEAAIGAGSWPVVVRVVIMGDSIRQCHDLLPGSKLGVLRWCDDMLLDRLCLALDRVGPLLAEML